MVSTIKAEKLSAEALKKRLAKEGKKVRKPKRFIEKHKAGFRIFPFALKADTPEAERKEMVKALRSALEVLEK